MHPGLHWSLLREAHARELAPNINPNLDQTSLLAYCWKVYIWPGKRVRFNGEPYVLMPVLADEPWIPAALLGAGDAKNDDEYGAVA